MSQADSLQLKTEDVYSPLGDTSPERSPEEAALREEDIRVNFRHQTEEFHRHSTTCFYLLFFIGLLNNNTYVVINTGAQDLAKDFGKKNLMGAFQM